LQGTVEFWTAAPLTALPWLAHGVTTRAAGVSVGDYATLNLSLHVGDDPDRVNENRRRAAIALGFSPSKMVCAEQVHGCRVAVVGASDAGRGAVVMETAIPAADALVTDTPGLLLALFFADCLPILLADPERRVVGLAHAGWRGLAAGVIEKTVETMGKRFGTVPRSLVAAVGPGIGPCCFEVGEDVASHFAGAVRRLPGTGKPHIDLALAAVERLTALGVTADQITRAGDCTVCGDPDCWFSHRRDRGRTGRMGALVGIKKQ
jgi:YfiH family protein